LLTRRGDGLSHDLLAVVDRTRGEPAPRVHAEQEHPRRDPRWAQQNASDLQTTQLETMTCPPGMRSFPPRHIVSGALIPNKCSPTRITSERLRARSKPRLRQLAVSPKNTVGL